MVSKNVINEVFYILFSPLSLHKDVYFDLSVPYLDAQFALKILDLYLELINVQLKKVDSPAKVVPNIIQSLPIAGACQFLMRI